MSNLIYVVSHPAKLPDVTHQLRREVLFNYTGLDATADVFTLGDSCFPFFGFERKVFFGCHFQGYLVTFLFGRFFGRSAVCISGFYSFHIIVFIVINETGGIYRLAEQGFGLTETQTCSPIVDALYGSLPDSLFFDIPIIIFIYNFNPRFFFFTGCSTTFFFPQR